MKNKLGYIVFCCICFCACKDDASQQTGAYIKERMKNILNYQCIDSCRQLIQPGDLLVRRGDDLTSSMFASLNKQDKRYSHCGLAVIEQDSLYVIHSIGGEDNPDQKVKKELFTQWVSVANNLRFAAYRYALDDTAIKTLIANVNSYYTDQKMFDMDFDLQTDDRLYCSEMIYKALRKTIDDSIIKPVYGYERWYVGIDNLYLNEQAKLICEVEYK